MLLTELVFWVGLFLIVYTYIGYPIVLLLISPLLKKSATQCDDDYCPKVSLVMAAYNEIDYIEAKIKNCLALDYPKDKLEILIGSDGSDDGTNEVVKQYSEQGIRFFEYGPRSGKMAVVNRLVGEAKNEICVFSDISELFDADAIRKLVRHYPDESVGAVTGNHIYNQSDSSMGKGTSFYWKFRRLLQSIESRLYSGVSCDGTIYSCRREVFPFPPDNTINDDVAVPLGILSKGKRIVFEPEAVIRGDVLASNDRFLNQKIRSQAGRYQNFTLAPAMFAPWHLRRFFVFMSHNALPVMVPWLLLIVLGTNIPLALYGGWFYQLLMALQVAFYAAAVIGYISESKKLNVPLVSIPYYFTMANVGSLLGFFAFMRQQQSAAWQKVE